MFGRHVSNDLSAYVHGELSHDASQRVRAHLEECVACRELYDEIRRGVFLAEHLHPTRAPADLWTGIASRLERGHVQEKAADLPLARIARRALAFGTLAVVLAASAFWYYRKQVAPRVDLDAYLRSVEVVSGSAATVAVTSAPRGFEEGEVGSALRLAGIEHVAAKPPLVKYRLARFGRPKSMVLLAAKWIVRTHRHSGLQPMSSTVCW